ncbi:hypothetical protein [Dactylosporangium sp. NPDC051541]|uniref:hypothetical protein n=1 Tax=Dactylosporangium sp. NPDC051541 TaxID=3363977 RepID=UPI0037B0A4DC
MERDTDVGRELTALGPADDELLARQAALQADGAALLAEFDFAVFGAVLLAGSYVSGLMVHPEVDVMVHAGPGFEPGRVLEWVVARPGVLGVDYRDERGPRSPTGTLRDERYHVEVTVDFHGRAWRLDLTLWLHDPHANVTEWHERLRDRLTGAQRLAILRVKDWWHGRRGYQGQLVYSAVLDGGVRTVAEFADWLAAREPA